MSALEKPIQTPDQASEPAAEAGIFLETEKHELGPSTTHSLPELINKIKKLEQQGRLIGQFFTGRELIIHYLPEEEASPA